MDPVRIEWPGGEHDFALPLGQLRALQDARDSGPEEILNRIRFGAWKIDDLTQTIRFGLVGGNSFSSAAAAQRVTELFDLYPVAQFKLCAITVLIHALFGPEDDQVGERQGVTMPAPENGGSAGSTETAP